MVQITCTFCTQKVQYKMSKIKETEDTALYQ
jgi:hypothetical protein